MEPPIAVFFPHVTVGEATEHIREIAAKRLFTYGYVVDATGRLLGVITMRDLLLHEEHERLEHFMLRQPFALRPEMERHSLDVREADLRFSDQIVLKHPAEDGRGKT